ncbi:caspase-3 [Oryzias latipes]|uniref:Caspase-3 n=3 Tax=Oryzias latipes TaxID=8090 RepID=A0A3P9LGK4_ORYLA|nr:caspase-3 [Oryzias latipes]BAC00949.1 caspase 3A [Oryzias latipes]
MVMAESAEELSGKDQVDTNPVISKRSPANQPNPRSTDVCVKKQDADPYRYSMDYPKMGICLIINNKNFHKDSGMGPRNGTDNDAAAAWKSFMKLGYEIQMYNDQTVDQMKKLFRQMSNQDHSKFASFACVILSHGEEGVIYGTDGPVSFNKLIECLKGRSCLSLVGKPKLFFIQACRGMLFDEGIEHDAKDDTSEKIPLEADFLFAYSTVSGYYSWRSTANGSWFIQSLCEMLEKFSKTLDLMQIMTRVNHKVATHFESSSNAPGFSGKKQIPCIVSMLTKDFYFPYESN